MKVYVIMCASWEESCSTIHLIFSDKGRAEDEVEKLNANYNHMDYWVSVWEVK